MTSSQAMASLGTVTALWSFSRRFPLSPASRAASAAMMASAYGQVGLGIATLLTFVPVSLGTAHQAGALTLLSSGLWFAHTLGRRTAAVVANKVPPQAVRLGALTAVVAQGKHKHPLLER